MEVANNIMLILVFMEVTRNIVIILLLGKSILTTFFRVGCVAILETYMKILKSYFIQELSKHYKCDNNVHHDLSRDQ